MFLLLQEPIIGYYYFKPVDRRIVAVICFSTRPQVFPRKKFGTTGLIFPRFFRLRMAIFLSVTIIFRWKFAPKRLGNDTPVTKPRGQTRPCPGLPIGCGSILLPSQLLCPTKDFRGSRGLV